MKHHLPFTLLTNISSISLHQKTCEEYLLFIHWKCRYIANGKNDITCELCETKGDRKERWMSLTYFDIQLLCHFLILKWHVYKISEKLIYFSSKWWMPKDYKWVFKSNISLLRIRLKHFVSKRALFFNFLAPYLFC